MSSLVERSSVKQATRAGVRWWSPALLLLVACVCGVSSRIEAQPVNDHFANAIAIGGPTGSCSGSTTNATAEPGEPVHYASFRAHGGRSVWYRWTSPTNGTVTMHTIGSQFDTIMAVYVGNSLQTLTQIASDDDSGAFVSGDPYLPSLVRFAATAGTEYFVAIDGYNYGSGPQFGPYVLNWTTGDSNIVQSCTAAGVEFSSSTYEVYENTPGFVTIAVLNDGANTSDLTVEYFTTDGTAFAGQDYLSVSNTLTFAPGDTMQTFTVPIIGDNPYQNSNKTFTVTLANIMNGQFGVRTNATVTILDDETPVFVSPAGQFNIITSNNFFGGFFFGSGFFGRPIAQVVTENETFIAPFNDWTINDRSTKGALVTVQRTGPAVGRVMVDFYTTNVFFQTNTFVGTNSFSNFVAQAGIDYEPVSGTLVFDDYQMMANFIVPIRQGFFQGGITNVRPPSILFDVVLANPRPAPEEDAATITPTLGPVNRASVEIVKINRYRAYSIERRTYRVDEYDSFARGGTNVVTGNISYLDVDVILPGGGCSGCAVTMELNRYGYVLMPGSDYADPFLLNLDNTPFTDPAAVPVINYPDYDINPAQNPNNGGTIVRIPFPDVNDPRQTVRILITNETMVEFNEDIGIFLTDPAANIPIGNGFASGTILFNEQPAGAADREWNPEGVQYTNPRFYRTPGANNTVQSVAVQADGKSLLAGDFTAVNAVQRNRIARMNTDGSLDATFNPGTGADGSVTVVVPYPASGTHSNKILIGGAFTSVNGATRQGIARLNPNGTVDNTFVAGNGANGTVRAIALQSDGKIIVVGEFTTFNDLNVRGIMRLNEDGSLDTTFNPGTGADGAVWDIEVQEAAGRTIYLCGEFGSFNGVMRRGIVRLTDAGAVDAAFDPGLGADGPVYALGLQADGKIIIGGAFGMYHTSPRSSLARIHVDGALDESYNVGAGANDSVFTISMQPDDKAVIGGVFTSYNLTRRMGLARILTSGSLDTSFMDTAYNQFAGLPKTFSFDNPSFVNSIALQANGDLIIGGSFTNVGGNLSVHYPYSTNTFDTATNSFGFRNRYLSINGRTNGINGGGHLFAPFTRQDKVTRFNVARIKGGYTPGPGNLEYDPASFPFNIDENSGGIFVTMRRVDGRLGTAAAIAATEDNTAEFPSDFTTSVSTQIWPEWFATVNAVNQGAFSPRSVGYVLPQFFTIPIHDDTLQEGDETFALTISNALGSITLGGEYIPLGASLGFHDRADATIADNDFNHGIINFQISEYVTNENSLRAIISVIRTNGSSGTVSVQFRTRDGSPSTATAGTDYTPAARTLTFGPGVTNLTTEVTILNNPEVEFDETVHLYLTNATGGAKLPGGLDTSIASAVLTIVDDDFLPGRLQFAATNFNAAESDGTVAVYVSRSGGNVGRMTVQYQVSNGTATSPADFTASSGTLVWEDGDSAAKPIWIPLAQDGVVEGPETVNLRVFNPSNAQALGGRTNATLTIQDVDSYGTISFSQVAYTADENGVSPRITVVRSGGSAGPVSVRFNTMPITATPTPGADADYSDTTGILTFQANEFSKTFMVPIFDDAVPDGEKTVQLYLSEPMNAGLGAITNVVLTIVDNESVNTPAGSLDTTFSTLASANAAVYALFQQTDGAIVMAGDFTEVSNVPRNRLARLKASGILDNSFDIGPGANNTIRALNSQSDGKLLIAGLFTTVNGTNRNRIARLSPDGAIDSSFNPGSGADNPVFALAVQPNDRILVGGAFSTFNNVTRPGLARLLTNGAVDLTFNVGAGFNGTVYTLALQNDGKVLVGGDFISFNGIARTNLVRLNPSGTLDTTFSGGLSIDAPVRALVVQPDGAIVIGGSFTNVNGVPRNFLARLHTDGSLDNGFLDGLSGADYTVFAIKEQLDGRLLVAGDFNRFNGVTRNGLTRLNPDGTTDPTINFGNGANAFVAALLIQPDRKIVLGGGFTQYDDQPRQFVARIYGGSIDGSGALEYSAPVFTVSETETNATITVRRRGGTTGEVRVDSFTTDGSAVAGVDYLSVSNTLVFPQGETRASINVPILPNDTPNGNRTVQLDLANFVNVVAGPQPISTLVILDDEASIGFSTTDFAVNENAVSGNATITLVRTGATNTTVSVDISTLPDSATDGADFVGTNATVTFLPGETTRLFNVRVLPDSLIEGNETVLLSLSNPSGTTTIVNGNAVLTIIDANFGVGQFLFQTNNFSVEENAGQGIVTILRTNGSIGIASVRLTTANGTATAFADYTPVNRVVTFADGETVKTVAISVANDSVAEPDETVLLALSQPTGGATILTPTSTLTIFDDEVVPSYVGYAMTLFSVNETDGFATISVVRTNSRRGFFTVDFSVSDGSAIAGQDYVFTNGTLVFNDGENLKTFTVPILNDTVGEGVETVRLRLDNLQGTNVFMALPTSTLNIVDDDTTLRFASMDYAVIENAGAATITVERVGVTSTAVSVDYATTPSGTAVGGVDYTPVTGTLTWAANDGAPKTFTVPIIDNNVLNPLRTVELILSNAVGTAAYLAAPTNATLTIIDDESVAPTAGPVDPLFNANFGANATVRTVTFDAQERLYVGGDFTQLYGLAINRIARLGTNGAVDLTFDPGSGADATVWGIARATNGIFAVGAFTTMNGAASARIAKLNLDGSVNAAFNAGTGPNDTAFAVASLPNDQVLVGGQFTAINGVAANRIARLNVDGSVDTTFTTGAGVNGAVRAIALQTNGQAIIAGDFTTVDGFLLTRIARVNADGTVDTSFDTGLGADGTVRGLYIQMDGKILVVGDFQTVNGSPRNGIVRLNPDGAVDFTFDPGEGANGSVRAVVVQPDGKVVVAGDFTAIDGMAANRIARLNANGSLDSTFEIGTGANAPAHALALANVTSTLVIPRNAAGAELEDRFTVDTGANSGTIIIDYNFYFVEDSLRVYYDGVRIFDIFTNGTDQVVIPYGPGVSTFVTVVLNEGNVAPGTVWDYTLTIVTGARLDNRIAVGGDFTEINDEPRGRVAVLNNTGSLNRGFDVRNISTRSVFALGINTNRELGSVMGKVMVGGDFTAIVGVNGQNRVARLNIDGTLDRTFRSGLGLNNAVRALAVQPDGKTIVGGLFTSYDLIARHYLARLNVDGTLDNTFNFANGGANINNPVHALVMQPDGKTIIGGAFTTVYGAPRNSIARMNTNGTVDVSFNPGSGANGPVNAVALQPDGKVLIGGDFTSVNGVSRFRIARLNANGTVDTSFNPGSGANGVVNAIALTSAGGVLIGGAFTSVDGQAAPRVAALTSSGGVDASFNVGTGANEYVTSLEVQGDGRILVGGNFTRFNGQVRNRIVRLDANGSLDPTINFGTGANDVVNAVEVQDYDGKIVIGGGFTEVDGLVRVAVARLFGGTNTGSGTFQFSEPTFTVNENGGSAVITVVRAGGTAGSASVNYSTANGTATSPADYSAVSGTLVFAPAENVQYINVPISNNGSVNGDRTFTVSIFSPSAGTSLGSPTTAEVTIRDDDSVISFTTADYVVNEAGGAARITVSRTGGVAGSARVDYATGTGSATAGADYTPVNGTLVFGPGSRSLSFDVPLLDDSLNEFNETVPLTLSNPVGGALGLASSTLTIIENDFSPGVITFGSTNYFVSEDAGFIAIEVLRTNGYSGPVTVNYTTTAGTATANVDYGSTNGMIMFADGQTNAFIVIQVLDDAFQEGNEDFNVTLSSPSGGATLGTAQATVLIIDNDRPGTFVFSQPVYTISESNTFATITVIRTNGNVGEASVNVQTSGGSATPTVDYGPVSTVLTFAPGQTVRTFNVQIFNDAIVEGTETVDMLLSNPSGTAGQPTIGVPGVATLQIIDDEVSVGFTVADFSVTESLTNVVITVFRTGDTNNGFTVGVNTSDATASAGSDYIGTAVTLNFAPGVVTQSFTVAVFDDQLAEGNEFLNLTLSNPSGGVSLGPIATARLNIVDNDTAFIFSSATYATNEAFVNAIVTVWRIGFNAVTSSVEYATFDGSATAPADYLSSTGRLVFAPGVTSLTFAVAVQDDQLVENNETVNLVLANPSLPAFLGPQNTAVLSILDNDVTVGFASTNYVVNEKGTNAVITIVRNGTSTVGISVGFRTVNGSAIAGVDYGAVSNNVVWAANDLSPKTVIVPIFDDSVAEGSETVRLELVNPVNAIIDPAAATGILHIVDNAGTIAFASANYSVVEGSGNALLNLVRTGGTNGTVSVNWNVVGGTATPGADYFGSVGTVVFAHGETTKAILLPVGDDGDAEGIETVNFVLSGADGGARVGSPDAATLSIVDNDTGIILGAGTALVFESFTPTNSIIEPNETVTILFALRNAGVVDAGNVTASLVYSNGVTHTNAQTQSYGALFAGGNSVSRPFTFTALGTNGSRITATLLITNDGLFLGPVSFDFTLGRQNIPFQNANAITIRDNNTANPYPATLTVSGVGGPVSGLEVTLHGLTHNYPDDIDMLLVGPNGAAVMLMSDAGGGLANALNNATIRFSDSAAHAIPDSAMITNGTYRAANYLTQTDPMPPFANNTPWSNTSLSTFNGINPNGVWSLYIVDDAAQQAGLIASGWSLSIATGSPVIPGSDLAVTITDAPDPVSYGSNVVYTIGVTNFGPATASAVMLTNVLPGNANFLSVSGPGSYTQNGNVLVGSVGNLAAGSGLVVTVTMSAQHADAQLTFESRVGAGTEDLNPGNNFASIKTTVQAPPAPEPVPALFAARKNNQLVLSWQGTATNVVLQSSSLSDGWKSESAQPVVSNGVSTVTVPMNTGTKFFRLRRVP